MRKCNKLSIKIVTLVILLSMPFDASWATAVSSDLLSPQNYIQPITPSQEYVSALNAYLVYCIAELRKKGNYEFASIGKEAFPDRVFHDKRVVVRDLANDAERSRWMLICSVDGRYFCAEMDLLSMEILAITPFAVSGRPMPNIHDADKRIALNDDAIMMAGEIISNTSTASIEEAVPALSKAIVSLLRVYFSEGLFNDIQDANRFFETVSSGDEVIAFLDAVLDVDSQRPLESMLSEIGKRDAGLARDLSRICYAFGKVFYSSHSLKKDGKARQSLQQIGYRRSEAFWRYAYLLDKREEYLHNWAWALKHCGMAEEARRRITQLLQNKPDNAKYLVERANIDIDEAEARIKKLERYDVTALAENAFLEETASLEVMLEEALGLRDILARMNIFYDYPRALSVAGKGYLLLARLNQYRFEYMLARFPDRHADAAFYAAEVLRSMSAGIWHMRLAYKSANDIGRTDARDHAYSFLYEECPKMAALLLRWSDAVSAAGIILPYKITMIRRGLVTIEEAVMAIPGIDTGLASAARQIIRGWVSTHEAIPKHFNERLAACRLEEITKSENETESDWKKRFFGSIVPSISTSLSREGSAGLVPDDVVVRMVSAYAAHYREKVDIDRIDLTLLYIAAELGKDCAGITDITTMAPYYIGPISEEEVIGRLKKAKRALGVTLNLGELKEMPPKEKPFSIHIDPSAPLIGGDAFKASINAKNRMSFVAHTARIRRYYDTLVAWELSGAVHQGYVSKLGKDVDSLVSSCAIYAANAEIFFVLSKNPKGRDAVREAASARAALSHEYQGLGQRIKNVEERLDKRIANVHGLINNRRVSLDDETKKARLRYGDISLEWLTAQFRLMGEYSLDMSMLIDQNNEDDYLSLDLFTSIAERADTVINSVAFFGEKLETYAPLFKILREADAEAGRFASYFGIRSGDRAYDLLAIYRDQLEDAKERVFSRAAEGRTCDMLSRDEMKMYEEIAARDKRLVRIREYVGDVLNELNNDEYYALDDMQNGLSAAIADVMTSVREEVRLIRPAMSKDRGFVSWICNMNTPCPGEDVLEQVLPQIKTKMCHIFDLNKITSASEESVFAGQCAWIARMYPEIVSEERMEKVAGARRKVAASAEEMKDVNSLDEAFDVSFGRICRESAPIIKEYSDAVKSVYADIRAEVAGQITPLKELSLLWLDKWIDRTVSSDPKNPRNVIKVCYEGLEKLSGDPIPEAIKAFYNVFYDFLVFLGKYKRVLPDAATPAIDASDTGVQQTLVTAYFNANLKPEMVDGSYGILLVPVIRNSLLVDYELIFVSSLGNNATSCFGDRLVSWSRMRPEDSAAAIAGNDLFELINKGYNYYCMASDEQFSDITINHEYFIALLCEVGRIYRNVYIMEQAPVSDLPEGLKSLRLEDVIIYAMSEVGNTMLVAGENEEKMLTADSPAKSFKNIAVTLLKSLDKTAARREITSEEQVLKERLQNAIIKGRDIYLTGWDNSSNQRAFLSSVLKLLGHVTGQTYEFSDDDLPYFKERATGGPGRPILTLRKDEFTRFFAAYPVREEFKGVYYDPELLSFSVSTVGAGSRSFQLCEALNGSFRSFLDELKGDGLKRQPERDGLWQLFLNQMFTGLRENGGKIDISVSGGLPVNSYMVGNTIILNSDFLEFLMSRLNEGIPPRLILGERLFHELGHVSRERRICASFPDEWDRMVESEVEQLKVDSIFHERIFARSSALASDMDRFVHKIVAEYGAKFSAAFNSAYLFKKIGLWSALYHSDKIKEMETDIRVTAIDLLSRINISMRR